LVRCGRRAIAFDRRIIVEGFAMNHEHQRTTRVGLAAKGLWLVGLGLLANAGVSLYTHATGRASDLSMENKALAQALSSPNPQAMLGARGLYMAPGQLGPGAYGVFLMDVDSGTIAVYQTIPDSQSQRIQRIHLAAVRSFKNDRFLEDWNTDKPSPTEVQALVAAQRQRQDLQAKTGQPTVDQTPKPDDAVPEGPDLPK
jgi:hypothetical protein